MVAEELTMVRSVAVSLVLSSKFSAPPKARGERPSAARAESDCSRVEDARPYQLYGPRAGHCDGAAQCV